MNNSQLFKDAFLNDIDELESLGISVVFKEEIIKLLKD